MFTQKPCLPVSMPRKRKRQAQSSSSLEKQTHGDGRDGTLCDRDELADNNNDDDSDGHEDDHNSDENDESDMEMNAATYLYRVREEARNLPDIWTAVSPTIKNGEPRKTTTNTDILTYPAKTTVASLSKEPKQIKKATNNLAFGSIASLQYLTSHRTKLYPPPTLSHIAMTGNKWVDQILAEFSQLRLYLEQCKNGSKPSLSERQPVPPMKDFMAWFTFCIGRNHAYPRGDSEVASTTAQPPQDPPTPAWKTNLPSNGDGHTPSVSLLLQMDQVMVRRVLNHLTNYINETSVDKRQNGCYVWIYALLARLERPIHRDDAVTLFTLLKRLTQVRSQVPESALSADPLDTPSRTMFDRSTTNNVNIDVVDLSNTRQFLATLNTLIAIVGVYFEQGGNYAQIMGVPSQP